MLPGLTDNKHNFLDIIIKTIGGSLAIVAFYIGLDQFKVNHERTYEMEFYKRELEIMTKIVETTSIISTYPADSSKFKSAYNDLLEMRNGKQYLFTDSLIDNMVGEFHSMIETYIRYSPDYTQGDLQSKSYEIAIECKRKINELKRLQ